ncbi:hypothetical protein F4808DRAFT_415559 [Astrocystis sublimbata]|nr:hypothetical protein F4808DRAFT_415559 [Astrocystis sublimbata]
MGISDSLKNPQQRAYLFVAIVFTLISVLAIILRFVANRRVRRKAHAEDWLALTSLLLYLGFGVVNLVDAIIASGREGLELLASPDDYAAVRKLIYSALWLYFYQQLFAKLSILALYYRLFWVKPAFKKCIDALVIYHALWITVTSFLIGFNCQPLARFFDPQVPGHCMPIGTLLAITETLNSFGDFLLVALAVVIINILQTSRSARRRLIIFFGLGILAGTIGFVKIGLSFSNDPVYVFTVVALWSNVQAGVGIVCCCATAYQPLLPSAGFWTRIASKVSFSRLRLSPAESRTHGSWGQSNSHDGYWMQRDDGTAAGSAGMVWSDSPRDENRSAAEDGHDLHTVQVHKDVGISR